MKRALLVAMLIAGTIGMTGCANGPIRSLFRGSPCGSTNRTTCNSTDYSCPSCGTIPSVDYYDSTIPMPPTGTIPAPGPGSGQ